MTRPLASEDLVVEVRIGTYVNTVRIAELFVDHPLTMEHGSVLSPVKAAYETWGTLNEDASNAVLLVHALTGDSHAASHHETDRPGWFEGVIGKDRALDPAKWFIVCANWLGSNYGTSGPASIDVNSGLPYGTSFPTVAVGDMSRVLKALTGRLGISKWKCIIGGSVGGMIVLDFIARFPGLVEQAIPMATAFRASPWVIGFHEIMRRILAIGLDSGDPDLLRRSLEAARMVGIVTYRSRQEFVSRYQRARAELTWQDEGCLFAVESYLRYQGKKLDERFDPITYSYLTKAADMFDLSETHGSLPQALARVRCPVRVVGIDSDYLFPLSEQEEIESEMKAAGIDAALSIITSENGHDGFLIEFDQLNPIISDFLGYKPTNV
jgi:homoserine O-acetyltransferase